MGEVLLPDHFGQGRVVFVKATHAVGHVDIAVLSLKEHADGIRAVGTVFTAGMNTLCSFIQNFQMR